MCGIVANSVAQVRVKERDKHVTDWILVQMWNFLGILQLFKLPETESAILGGSLQGFVKDDSFESYCYDRDSAKSLEAGGV